MSQMLEDILRRVSMLAPRFKYCANGYIAQNCGAAFHVANYCRYEKGYDKFAHAVYQAGSIFCCIVVYGFRL